MEIFIGAGLLSIWQSILFWNQRVGISALLFVIPLIILTIKIFQEKVQNKKALLISIPIILLSSTYFIFNNELFRMLNAIIIPILYVMMLIFANSKIELKQIIYKMILIIIEPLNEFGEVLKQIKQKCNIKTKEKTNRPNIVKALIITGLIVLVVICLLASADEGFGKIFVDILKWFIGISIPSLVFRVVFAIFVFFYLSSFFINMLSKYNVLKEFEGEENTKTKESYTIRMILTVLNIVYLLFCIVVIKGLFNTKDIIYSQYARQGFFQLMIVSLINLVVILKATNKNLEEDEKQKKYKKTMCLIMIGFTFVIIILSLVRMAMYQHQYGYTRLRVLVDFTLITEIILLIPTALYIIKEKINLGKSYFIIIVVMYCVVNFANIDRIIAKNNINLFISTGKLDFNYLVNEINTTDIIPELIRLQKTELKYYKIDNQKNQEVIDIYKKRLDQYLEGKFTDLDIERTIPEFNLSEWNAKLELRKTKNLDR